MAKIPLVLMSAQNKPVQGAHLQKNKAPATASRGATRPVTSGDAAKKVFAGPKTAASQGAARAGGGAVARQAHVKPAQVKPSAPKKLPTPAVKTAAGKSPLAKKAAEQAAEKTLLKKGAAKAGARFIPGVGQGLMAYDAAMLVNQHAGTFYEMTVQPLPKTTQPCPHAAPPPTLPGKAAPKATTIRPKPLPGVPQPRPNVAPPQPKPVPVKQPNLQEIERQKRIAQENKRLAEQRAAEEARRGVTQVNQQSKSAAVQQAINNQIAGQQSELDKLKAKKAAVEKRIAEIKKQKQDQAEHDAEYIQLLRKQKALNNLYNARLALINAYRSGNPSEIQRAAGEVSAATTAAQSAGAL